MKKSFLPIPVILDTDIGTDIDDTWALALLLRCPELEPRLVVSATGNTEYRARLAARLLQVAGRTDVPVGIGLKHSEDLGPQATWLGDYTLEDWPGPLHVDGIQAIIETIKESPVPLTLICIGPLTNIAEALRRAPEIAPMTRFVGMQGSIRKHHGGADGAITEFNVLKDIAASQFVFAAPWLDRTITPLDTCAQVRLRGARYAAIARSRDNLLQSVIENYRLWLGGKPDVESSLLYDTVAVHLAFSTRFLAMRRMGITVTDEGFTVPDEGGSTFNVAMDWTDLEGFEDNLVNRLCG